MSAMFTPGPWSIAGMALIVATEPEFPHRVTVARSNPTGELPPEVEQANARLIAAAPDLLEACASAEAGISDWRLGAEKGDQDDMRHMTASVAYLRSVMSKLRAAIAKAEGR